MTDVINQDLQATSKIINVMERSKYFSDNVLDNLPNFYLVINEKGTILKGNVESSNFINVELEDLLRREFSFFFKEENWSIFKVHLQKILQKHAEKVEFELPIIKTSTKEIKTYFWQIRPFASNDEIKAYEGPPIFVVIGTDITELRAAEKQIAEIFSSISLGILTINDKGLIEEKYSAFTEHILNSVNLANKNIKEMLFDPCWPDLTPAEREGVGNLMNIYGKEEMMYDGLKETFPKKIRLLNPIKDEHGEIFDTVETWLGLSYQGIISEGVVSKMLLIIEDRTKIVLAERENERAKLLEDKTVSQIIQVKSCDSEIFDLVTNEINGILKKVETSKKQKDSAEVLRALHGIKGNAKIAGLKHLATLTHHVESWAREEIDKGLQNLNWDNFNDKLKDISSEWDEINSLQIALLSKGQNQEIQDKDKSSLSAKEVSVLFKQYNQLMKDTEANPKNALLSEKLMMSIQFMNYSPLSTLEDLVKTRVEKISGELNKKVSLKFEWGHVKVSEVTKSELSECFLHLLNNSLDHGIESPEDRIKNGKPEYGTITIVATSKLGALHFNIFDDGGGIDVRKVKSKLVENGIISLRELVTLSDEEIIQYIFKPGFSTKQEITEISGRGVGLDSVASIIRKMGGHIAVSSKFGRGCEFKFSVKGDKEGPMEFNCLPIEDFLNLLSEFIETMNDEGFNIKFDTRGVFDSLKKYFMYIDHNKLCLALTTLIGQFSNFADTKLILSIANFEITCEILLTNVHDKANTIRDSDYLISLPQCEDIIFYHNGHIERKSETQMFISFGLIVNPSNISLLKIGISNGFNLVKNKDILKNTLSTIQELMAKHAIKYEFDLKNENNPNVFLIDTDQSVNGTFIKISKSKTSIRRQCFAVIKSLIDSKTV